VLTAAHCTDAFDNGLTIGGIKRDESDGEFHDVDTRVPHPEYDSSTYLNDIMIVKLATPSTKPIQTLNLRRDNPFPDDSVTVIGFGDIADNVASTKDLLEVTINAYSDDECVNLNDADYSSEEQFCGMIYILSMC
jgi:secreted trypsin-like serine protease